MIVREIYEPEQEIDSELIADPRTDSDTETG